MSPSASDIVATRRLAFGLHTLVVVIAAIVFLLALWHSGWAYAAFFAMAAFTWGTWLTFFVVELWQRTRLQFGLRMLLALVAAFAVPLALWQNGRADLICAGFFAAISSLFVVVVGGMYGFGLLEWWLERSNRRAWVEAWAEPLLKNVLMGQLVVIGCFAVTGVAFLTYESYSQHRLKQQLQRELGFVCRTEHHNLPPFGGRLSHLAAIESIVPDRAFDRAGFQPDDIILHDDDPPQLFQMLDRCRGQSVELTVLRPLATQPLLEKCPRLALVLDVPP